MSVKVYNKLVRDNIPAIIRAEGKSLKMRQLDDAEFQEELLIKLGEEYAELKVARNIEELADVYEVLLALAEVLGATSADLEKVRAEKAADRGAYKNKIFLESVGAGRLV